MSCWFVLLQHMIIIIFFNFSGANGFLQRISLNLQIQIGYLFFEFQTAAIVIIIIIIICLPPQKGAACLRRLWGLCSHNPPFSSHFLSPFKTLGQIEMF